MMLVSSSGWAHSPITLILTDLSAVYGAAFAPGAAARATTAAVARTTPKRFTSPLPPPMRVALTLAPLRTTSNRDLANVIPGFGSLSSQRGYPLTSRAVGVSRCSRRGARRARERPRRAAPESGPAGPVRALRRRAHGDGQVDRRGDAC